MTIRRPEEKSLLSWAFEGLSLKTIILYTVMLCGGYYALSIRLSVAEAKIDDHADRLKIQRESLKTKVDKDAYEADQRNIAQSLAAIRDTTGRIEDILMRRSE